MRRYLLLKDSTSRREYVFVAEGVRDSRFLSYALSDVDPGDDYSVKFTSTKPRMTATRDFWSQEAANGGVDFEGLD